MAFEGKPITIKGITYPSIRKACEAWNMDLSLYGYRVRQGMSPEKAITTPRGPYDKGLVVKGCIFPTKAEACEYFGINYNTFHTRLLAGMEIEQALTKPIKKR